MTDDSKFGCISANFLNCYCYIEQHKVSDFEPGPVFRAEIEQALCDTDSNCAVIGELCKVVRAALPKWLPLDEIHAVVAPMLDPSQRSLRTVKDYLVERGVTTVDIDKIRSQVCGPCAGRGSKEDSTTGEAVKVSTEQPTWKKQNYIFC